MLLRVLGPLEVAGAEGPVALGATKQRVLLSALAIRIGSSVATDFLLDCLWGERPPASGGKLLQVYVSQLRKALPTGLRIVTDHGGYRLDVDRHEVDAAVFEQQLSDGSAALRDGNPALAASLLARALGLWRGPAFADVRYESFALHEVERLERLRDLAFERRVDADLELGRNEEVLADLRGSLALDATREVLAARAMVAAFRAGDPAEALAIYASTRAALLEELGEEPGPELVELRQRIVDRDPDLAGGRRSAPTSSLPVPPNTLIGRRRELDELRALTSRPGVRFVTLTGAGGSGKSRLALEFAHEVATRYANGVVLVELASLRDEELVPATIARGLRLEPGRDAVTTLREALANREVLLVLDNVEHLRGTASLLVRLLADAPRLVVLLTSRVVLHVSGEHVFPVAPLTDQDAQALFVERARAQDAAFELDSASEPVVAAICRRLDGLPLPIELAAARVRALGLRTLRERLESRLTVLAGGPRDLPARQQTLRETLDWSVQQLEPRRVDVLAALGVFPASFGMDAAQRVTGADDEAMIDLVDHNLVQALESAGERRFRLLETLREYALERLGTGRDAAESALADWMVDLAATLELGSAGPPRLESLRRLDLEIDTLRTSLRCAAHDADATRELAIASATWHYWWLREQLAEARATYDAILDRRGFVATEDGVRVTRAAASFAWAMGNLERCEQLGMVALAGADQVGDTVEQIFVRNLLGVIAKNRGNYGAAAGYLEDAIRLAESRGDLERTNLARLNLGVTYLETDRIEEARAQFQAVLDHRVSEGLSEGVGYAHLNLGETEFAATDYAAAERHFVAAAESFRAIGFGARYATSLQGIAAVEVLTGRPEAAARRLGSAASLLARTDWSIGSSLSPAATASARAALGDERFERLFREGGGDIPG